MNCFQYSLLFNNYEGIKDEYRIPLTIRPGGVAKLKKKVFKTDMKKQNEQKNPIPNARMMKQDQLIAYKRFSGNKVDHNNRKFLSQFIYI